MHSFTVLFHLEEWKISFNICRIKVQVALVIAGLFIREFAVCKHITKLNIREFISTFLVYMQFLIHFKEESPLI